MLIIVVLLSCFSSIAQNDRFNFGIKAGLNYGDNGNIEFTDLTNAGNNIISENASARLGFHAGVYLRGNLTSNLYIKPELQFSLDKSSFEFNGTPLDYKVSKLDLPILIGVSLLGPLHVFGGPSLQYIVNTDLEDVKLDDVKNNFTVGLQFGVGIQIKRLNLDVRYERGLSKNQARVAETNIGQPVRVDSRPNQFLLSLGIDF